MPFQKKITLSYHKPHLPSPEVSKNYMSQDSFGQVQKEIIHQSAKKSYVKGFISGAALSGIMLVVATAALPLASSLSLIGLGAFIMIFL